MCVRMLRVVQWFVCWQEMLSRWLDFDMACTSYGAIFFKARKGSER